MNCKQRLWPEISRHIDGELTLRDRRRVSGHLRECERCRGFSEVLRRNERLVADALIGAQPVILGGGLHEGCGPRCRCEG